jgi:GNAT superfamily N-acetyltransferase
MEGKRLPPMDVDYSLEIEEFPCWVAEHKGKIVGGLIMMFDDEHASIANIAVHPDFQGQGLGGELMRFAESIAKKMNFSELRLATHVLLTENISLYLHLGWIEIDRDDVRVYFKKEII